MVTNKILKRAGLGLAGLLLGLAGTANAAVSSFYTFSQPAPVTYVDIQGAPGETVIATGTTDDANFTVTLPFTFSFDGTPFTQVEVNSNGFFRFGTGLPGTGDVYTPISSTTAGVQNVVSPLGGDLQGLATGRLTHVVEGTLGSQIWTLQWKNYRSWNQATQNYNFQVKLYEATGVIEFVYGTNNHAAVTARTRQVGLRGVLNTDFNNRTTTTNWAATTAGATNAATCSQTSTVGPASGLVLRWSPPPPDSVQVGNFVVADNGTANVPVTLINRSATTMTLTYSTSDGSATVIGADYTPVSGGTVEIPPSITSAVLPVTVLPTAYTEPTETFTVTATGATPVGTILGGGNGTVTITNSVPPTCIFTEDFSTSSVSPAPYGTPPTGWTLANLLGPTSLLDWDFSNRCARAWVGFTGAFAVFDNDNCGTDPGGPVDQALVSPAFDTTGAGAIRISYLSLFRPLAAGDFGAVEVSGDGTNWTRVRTTTTAEGTQTLGAPTLVSFEIPASLMGTANSRIRFRYSGDWAWWWAIDDVQICTINYPAPAVSHANASGGAGTINVPVTASANVASDVTTTFSAVNGTAVSGVDYTGPLGPVTIVGGTNTANLQFTGLDDGIRNPSKTFTAHADTLTGPAVWPGSANATVTVLNATPLPLGRIFGASTTGTQSLFDTNITNYIANFANFGAGSGTAAFYRDGDFAGNDFTKFYALNGATIDEIDTTLFSVTDSTPLSGLVVVDSLNNYFIGPLMWDRTSGQMYLMTIELGAAPPWFHTIYTVNLSTGVCTPTAVTGLATNSAVLSAAIHPDGTIYALDTNFNGTTDGVDSLYRINRTTGAATLVGLTGQNTGLSFGGMDFDNATRTLYSITRNGAGTQNNIWSYNQTTGAATLVANVFASSNTTSAFASATIFSPNLTVASAYGTATPPVGTASYTDGTTATLSVAGSPVAGGPGEQFVCTGWTGTGDVPATGSGTSVNITHTQDSSITWVWQQQFEVIITINPLGAGSVSLADGYYDAASVQSITATPNVGFSFVNFTGDLTSSANPSNLTVSAPRAVTANFQVSTSVQDWNLSE